MCVCVCGVGGGGGGGGVQIVQILGPFMIMRGLSCDRVGFDHFFFFFWGGGDYLQNPCQLAKNSGFKSNFFLR